MQRLFTLRTSIFGRLFLVVLVTCFVIDVAVVGSMRFLSGPSQESRALIEANVRRYVDLLWDNLGSKPTEAQLRSLAQETGLRFKWESEGKSLLSSEDFAQLKVQPFGGPPNISITRGRETLTAQIPTPVFNSGLTPLVILLLILTATVSLAYVAIRRSLYPLRDLMTGVEAVSKADFSHTVPVRGHDEVSRLALAFNAMIKTIGEMISAKEQLLLDVSHELRSPLTRMRLSNEFFPDSKAKSRLLIDIGIMESMIDELLESQRLASSYGALGLVDCDVTALLSEVVGMFEGRPPGMRTRLAPDVRASVDPKRLAILWRNLLENACKYSHSSEEQIEVVLRSRDDMFIVTIADKGVGVPPNELDLVFEPFYRVDKSRDASTGGFGLGLPLCQKIVKAHGGNIRLESLGVGQGTTVTVVLPKGSGATT